MTIFGRHFRKRSSSERCERTEHLIELEKCRTMSQPSHHFVSCLHQCQSRLRVPSAFATTRVGFIVVPHNCRVRDDILPRFFQHQRLVVKDLLHTTSSQTPGEANLLSGSLLFFLLSMDPDRSATARRCPRSCVECKFIFLKYGRSKG